MACLRLCSGRDQCDVRFTRPSRKKADSMFSRKLTAWKTLVPVSERLVGGGVLGGPPPAATMTWGVAT